MQGYNEVVAGAWNKAVNVTNPFLRLHIKLKRTSVALRKWAKGLIGQNKVLMCAAGQLIAILDVVQEYRALSDQEIRLRRDLKLKFLGMAAVEKLRAKQSSRLHFIRASEASSKLFFLQANGRRRKNYIQSLQTAEGMFYKHEEKEHIVFDHFCKQFGPPEHRNFSLNWSELGLQRHDLAHLDDDFTGEELQAVVQDIAAERAPGPDGFIGVFFKHSWMIVRQDLMLAVNFFSQLHGQHFNRLNSAQVVLIPKKADAKELKDHTPVW